MPTQREREYYRMGFSDGFQDGVARSEGKTPIYTPRGAGLPYEVTAGIKNDVDMVRMRRRPSKKRKLSAWNKFVKANSKKPRFRLRSGSPNLKKLAVAFRKTPAGKKKRR